MSAKTTSVWQRRVDSCEKLDDLFALWTRDHLSEVLAGDYPQTFPKSRNGRKEVPKVSRECFKGSFCPDGIASLEKEMLQGPDKVDILFILRETNLEDGKGEIHPETGDIFWFNHRQKDRTRTVYANRFRPVLNSIGETEGLKTDRFGYTNLNKRGGFKSCKQMQLRNYVKEYRGFIQKEIELFAQKVVVCCGTFGTVYELLTDALSDGVRLWGCYHPSARRQKPVTEIKKWRFYGTLKKLMPEDGD